MAQRASLQYRVLRGCKTFGLVLLVAYVVLFAVTEVDARVQQRRAELLLKEMRSLEPGRSTWADFNDLRARWGRLGDASGACTRTECTYTISTHRYRRICALMQLAARLVRLGHGGYVPTGTLWVNIHSSLVQRNDFVLDIAVPSGLGLRWRQVDDQGPVEFPFFANDDELLARADEVESAKVDPLCCSWPETVPHPEYLVVKPNGCVDCIMTEFSVNMSQAEKDRLTDFNLDCMTRWNPCTSAKDIMPEAAKELRAESVPKTQLEERISRCYFSLQELAESSLHAAVVEVENMRPDSSDLEEELQLKLLRGLDATLKWKPGEARTITMPSYHNGNQRPRERETFIVLLPTPDIDKDIGLYPCGMQPYSEANAKLVSEAIAKGKGLPLY